MHDNTLKALKQIASDLSYTMWSEGRKEGKKSFETDLTMPNNPPETAQKNNLSSWKSLYTQLIFLNTIYLQTHTHSGIFEEKKHFIY